jgi:peptide/nickel transport system substrate-binding protein
VSTANLAFVADKVDWLAMSIPLLRETRSQARDAVCEVTPGGISRNLIINRDAPPFDNAEMRRAMALVRDSKAFIDMISEGKGYRRGYAAAARRRMGNAAGSPETPGGL